MAQTEKQLANLKYHQFKKGDSKTIAAAGKGRRGKSIRTIINRLSELDPAKIFPLDERDKEIALALKTMHCKTTRDFIVWKLLDQARKGNLLAIKMYIEQLGEGAEKVLRIEGSDKPLSIEVLIKKSSDELKKIEGEVIEALSC